MIDVKTLTKKYADLTAVENLSFHVSKGEIFGFLGPNGAGKTIIIRMLCGLISITSGQARIAGCQVGDGQDALPAGGDPHQMEVKVKIHASPIPA
jgi:ABC-2 type transport system ATP-binding protein